MRSLNACVSGLCLTLALAGCPGGGGSQNNNQNGNQNNNNVTGNVTLEGAVHKGPFLVQSSIQVSVLDGELNPTGTVYNTETTNDLGEFAIQFQASGAVAVEGNGYYYNEVSGGLSASTLTLRAFYVPTTTGTQNAYVNMITHLTTGRVKALVTGGSSFEDAVAQAELELMQELDITATGYSPSTAGVRMNVTGEDNDDNAYLLAVSAVLTKVAIDRGGSVEANVQAVLNEISTGFVGGTLTQGIKDEITASLPTVNTAQVMANLGTYLTGKNHTDPVPDMDRVIDQDRDGLANSEDNCPRDPNPGQEDDDSDGVGNACDSCPSTACPDQCLPASANPALTEDLCYTECESETAGPCQTGTCVAAPYADAQAATQVLRLCTEACDPLAADPCASGSFCGHRAPLPYAPPLSGVYACLPEGFEGPGGLGSPCDSGPIDPGVSSASESSMDCQGSLYCGLIGSDAQGFAFACRQPCDPASPAVCGAESCEDLSATEPAGLPGLCELPPGSIGDPCFPGSCQEGLACAEPMTGSCTFSACCQEAGAEGEHCYDDGSCDAGLGCLSLPACGNLNQCCLVAGGLDQPCFDDHTCSEGFGCFNENEVTCPTGLWDCCKPAGGYLEACINGGQCSPGLQCSNGNPPCSAGADPCCALPETSTGTLYSACLEGGVCMTGLACSTTGCPYPTPDCCLPSGETGGLGEPCNTGDICDTLELRCMDYSGSGYTCENGLTECCVHAGEAGEPCRSDGTCSETWLMCQTTDCAPWQPNCCRAPACASDQQCASYPGTSCLDMGMLGPDSPCGMMSGSCCLPAGGEGEYCYQDNSCDPGLICAGLVSNPMAPSTCIPGGGLDEACGPGNYCDPGLSCTVGSTGCAPGYEIGGCCQVSTHTGLYLEACTAGACADGLTCVVDDGTPPAECPWGTADCCLPVETGGLNEACNTGGTCDSPELACVEVQNICGNNLPDCCKEGGGIMEPCRTSGAACDDGLTCETSGCPSGYPSCCKAPSCDPGYPGACVQANGFVCTNMEPQACGFTMSDCCLPAGAEGEACYGDWSCDAGLRCLDHHSGFCEGVLEHCCVTSGGLDQPCNTDNTCNTPDLGCVSGTCVLVGGLDQPCNAGNTCNTPDLGCVSGTCVLVGGLGQPCRIDNTCDPGLSCYWDPYTYEQSCVVSTHTGLYAEACDSGSCADGLTCVVDDGVPPEECPWGHADCCMPVETGGLNEACNTGGTCDSADLVCLTVQNACGNNLPECCKEGGGTGQPCLTGDVCDDPLTCETTGCPAGYPNCCKAPLCDPANPGSCIQANGAACASWEMAACDWPTPPYECCLPAGGAGETCYDGSTCDPDLVCVSSSEYCPDPLERCCSPSGGLDEPCNPDNTCDSPDLSCLGGVPNLCPDGLNSCCKPTGGLDEPCNPGSTCDTPDLMCVNAGCASGVWECCRLPGTYDMLCRTEEPYCDTGLTCQDCTNFGFPMGSQCCL